MSEVLEIVVEAAAQGERLDRFLRRHRPELSRAALRELLEEKRVRVNGAPARKGQTVRAGDRVALPALDPEIAFDAELPLNVLYEDAALVAIDKPAGVPSHALRRGERGTIASALLARYPEMRELERGPLEAGLLHRLDTDTSGVLIAARSGDDFARLHRAHRAGRFQKTYLALCVGQVAPGVIHGYLRADRRRVRVDTVPGPGAKPIITEIVASEPHRIGSLVRMRVQLAGRHQLRAQLAALGHAIVGDTLYGGPSLPGLTRHFLHAAEVELPHPSDGRVLQIASPLPPELSTLLTDS